jgi:type VI secretion system protein ImpH
MEAFELARHLCDPLVPLNHDALVFKVSARANHPATEVHSCKKVGLRWVVEVPFMGLVGHRSPMPDYYQASMACALREKNDAYLDFLNIFQNRIVGLAYKAWLYCRPSLTYNNKSPLLRYSGLLMRRSISRLSAQIILSDYFDLLIKVIDFDGGRVSLTADDRSVIGGGKNNNQLGVSMVAGEKVLFPASACRLRIGPLGFSRFMQLLPRASLSLRVMNLARQIISPAIDISIELILKKDDVPLMRLGEKSSALLGLNTWVKSTSFKRDVDDMHYVVNAEY